MDVLYIPQLEEADATGGDGPATRYRILKRVPESGEVLLADRAVTRIGVAAADPLKLIVPPLVKGAVRDFFVRLVITADEIPEITFAAPAGETISFEDVDEDVFKCDIGVNVFAFTETDQGIFIVNRKLVDIDFEVEFDPVGGMLDKTKCVFKLGAQYSALPNPTRAGYTFLGWFTSAEEGVKVEASDPCKTGVVKLYARWEVYADPFVDLICHAKNLTFFSESEMPWFTDWTTFVTAPASARSGAIGDNGSTALTTTVQGRGTLSFKWKVSSEDYYDYLRFFVDGTEIASICGQRDWADFTQTIASDGAHAVEWRYTKDGSSRQGGDCGWIDEVSWIPAEG
jgi:uncharacterized repeat protein (TIGR02543 family)